MHYVRRLTFSGDDYVILLTASLQSTFVFKKGFTHTYIHIVRVGGGIPLRDTLKARCPNPGTVGNMTGVLG